MTPPTSGMWDVIFKFFREGKSFTNQMKPFLTTFFDWQLGQLGIGHQWLNISSIILSLHLEEYQFRLPTYQIDFL
jgi:hypothetical protein